MLKLFSERLKDQAGLAFVPVLIVASLVITGLGLWSVGTEAKKTIDKKEPLYKYSQENNTEDAEAYQEEINKAMVKAAVEGGKVAVGAVAGARDPYLVTTALDKAGAFDTEEGKTTRIDSLDPPPASQEDINRLMQLTEDELDRILEEVGTMDITDPDTGKEIDFGYSDEEINRLLEETGNLDYGIEKMVKKKVELNSDPEITPEEKKNIVDETVKNIQKAEDTNTKVDLNSWVKTILQGADKLADQKLVDLRYKLKRNELSYEYNFSIIQKYEEYQAKGQGITDTEELAEAKRRVADLYDETKVIEAQIKELEDAKQITQDNTVASESEETKGLTDANAEEADTQPTETKQEIPPDTVLPAELNLKGNFSTDIGEVITLNINFETQIVSGTISCSGPMTWNLYDIDANGNKIPGSEKSVVLQTTVTGTINGKFDINNKLIDASFSEYYSAFWEKINNNVTNSGTSRMSGALNENNNASGTTAEGIAWSAKPY